MLQVDDDRDEWYRPYLPFATRRVLMFRFRFAAQDEPRDPRKQVAGRRQ